MRCHFSWSYLVCLLRFVNDIDERRYARDGDNHDLQVANNARSYTDCQSTEPSIHFLVGVPDREEVDA